MSSLTRTQITSLTNLRLASLVEGATLLILVGVAVPLKHLAGVPSAVSFMGPLHGTAFLLYVWMLINAASAGELNGSQTFRAFLAALVPFATFYSAALIKQKIQSATIED